jgi:hypothetical protein
MPDAWQDIARKSTNAKKLHPDLGECVIEIVTTASMPERWINYFQRYSMQREIRYDNIGGNLIVARAEHPKAVETVVGAIDWAMSASNAAYRERLGLEDVKRAREQSDAARLAEQQAELDEIVKNIPPPED